MISLVLLPSETDTEQIIALSERLSGSQIALGNEALPHITVALFDAPAEDAASLWHDTKDLLKSSLHLTSGGLGFVLSREGGRVWVELQFLNTSHLIELQRDVLETAYGKSNSPLNAIGAGYRPHCTIGLLSGESSSQVTMDGLPVFQRVFKDMRLAVGVNGENFAFAQPLFVLDA